MIKFKYIFIYLKSIFNLYFSFFFSLSSLSLCIILEIHPFLPHILYDSLEKKGNTEIHHKPLKEYNGEQTLASSVEDDLTNSCGRYTRRAGEMYARVPRARVRGYRNHPCLTRES